MSAESDRRAHLKARWAHNEGTETTIKGTIEPILKSQTTSQLRQCGARRGKWAKRSRKLLPVDFFLRLLCGGSKSSRMPTTIRRCLLIIRMINMPRNETLNLSWSTFPPNIHIHTLSRQPAETVTINFLAFSSASARKGHKNNEYWYKTFR